MPIWTKNSSIENNLRGFTLLEVLVALAIVSVGLLSVSTALSRAVTVNESLEERTVGVWIVGNKMAELRMSREFSASGENSSSVSMAGRNWKVLETYYSTSDPDIARVVVSVFIEGEEDSILNSTGYLARYVAPGQ